MDLTIVAVYTISDDLLISLGHQEHPLAKMLDAEVMTTAIIAARYFGGNQHTASAVLKTLGYIPNMLDTRVSTAGCIRSLNTFKGFLKASLKRSRRRTRSISTVLIPSRYGCVITFAFHAHAGTRGRTGAGGSQANASIFIDSKHT